MPDCVLEGKIEQAVPRANAMTVCADDFTLPEFLLDGGDRVSGSNHAGYVRTFGIADMVKIHGCIVEGLSAVRAGFALESPNHRCDLVESRQSILRDSGSCRRTISSVVLARDSMLAGSAVCLTATARLSIEFVD